VQSAQTETLARTDPSGADDASRTSRRELILKIATLIVLLGVWEVAGWNANKLLVAVPISPLLHGSC
jgi:hypothetical protein